jgi:hypothetical protein
MAAIGDVCVYDTDILSEIEMTTNLMIVASAQRGRLSQETIDDTLGVRRP